MIVADWLKLSTELLEEIGTARLDCLVLLEDAIGKERAWLLAHPEFELTRAQASGLTSKIKRRAKHEPLSYIRGKTEFYGREFKINKYVLEPRPESETMIDLLKEIATAKTNAANKIGIADVGAGSGAIGITAALELPNTSVHLYEIDKDALTIAKYNARRYKLKLQYYTSDLLDPNWGPYDIILANLPYVPDSYKLNDAAMNEPKIAIFGGEDGLDLYRRLFQQIASMTEKSAYVFTESLPFQHKKLAAIAKTSGFSQSNISDFIQVFKRI